MTNDLSATITTALSAIVGPENLVLDSARLKSGSKDSYHFSPILLEELSDKNADYIVFPTTQAQLLNIIKLAYAHQIPITPRGAGTGNYGQGIPLQGGILINTKKLNRILSITAESARVECGTVLWQIEKEAAQHNAELRIFPSTVPTSSAAGFVTGGSGGVGSITWGMLNDNQNVRAMKIITCEAEPQILELNTTEAMREVMHNCGLTAFVVEVEFSLAPKTAWHQYAFAVDDFYAALALADKLAKDEQLHKRLCSVFEWPIPSYFLPLVKKNACPDGKAMILFMCDRAPDELLPYIAERGEATMTFHSPPPTDTQTRGFQIYDFTWNHTTMWAMKVDSELTYLQDGFDPDNYVSQMQARKAEYGDDVATHVEFMKTSDGVRPGGLSVVRFKGREHLQELMNYCESIGIRISNPHTHYLDADIRWFGDYLLSARQKWDPKGLLNPGHLKALEANP